MNTLMQATLLSVLLCAGAGVRADSLSIEVGQGMQAGEPLMVAIYDQEAHWLRKSMRGVREMLPAGVDSRSWHALTIDELPPGRYAVAVYIDRNANGKLDRGMFGIPSEPYGFSNGGGSFGPPDFKDATFEVGEAPAAIRIELN